MGATAPSLLSVFALSARTVSFRSTVGCRKYPTVTGSAKDAFGGGQRGFVGPGPAADAFAGRLGGHRPGRGTDGGSDRGGCCNAGASAHWTGASVVSAAAGGSPDSDDVHSDGRHPSTRGQGRD